MTSPVDAGQYLQPLTNEFALRLAQAVCGDDHLMCSWPGCECTSTKRKINAVALVVAEEITGISERVKAALETAKSEP